MAWISPIIPPDKPRKIDSAALLFEKATRADIPSRHSPPVITSHPDYQKLFEIDLMRDQGLLKHPTSGDLAAAKKNCPLCRKAIFTFNLEHTDSLELMQVRLRLTNLAYQVCGFRRTGREQTERIALQQFLAWRWAEETSCKQDGTVVSMPDWADCVRLFKLARLGLRDEAWRYMRDYILLASEQMRVLQLITFFENIKLRSDLVAAFFMLDPTLNQDWVFNQTTERFHHLTTDPVSFCTSLWIRVAPKSDLFGWDVVAIVKVDMKEQVAALGHEAGCQSNRSTPESSVVPADGDIDMPDAL
ncbi:MAG: hypothetical protein Q9199_004006 [Rusavskia elegans]